MEKVTPETGKTFKRSIMIGCLDFSEMTGMPMYNLRIAKEFMRRGRWVSIVAPKVGGDMEELAREAGVECIQDDNPDYKERKFDVLLLNEKISEKYLADFPTIPAYNYCHSKMGADEPIEKRPQIRGYMAPRKQVADYWHKKTGYKFDILPIPIDFEKYSVPPKRQENYQTKIVCICTFNEIREGMIRSLIEDAKKDGTLHVTFVGKDFGVMERVGELPENVIVYPETKNPETYIKDCDITASLYVGTTCLEGWAMGKPCRVYQDNNKYKLLDPPEDLKVVHSVENIVDKFLEVFDRKWADIVIPHHDRPELLADCLKSIPIRNFNILISRGGNYAYNCNKMSKVAETDRIIFINDDMVLTSDILWKMSDVEFGEYAAYGVKQVQEDGTPICVGIFINQHGNYEMTTDPNKALYPSGGAFVISREVFKEVGGLNEGFMSGGEDQDLFLKVLEKGYKLGTIEGEVIHHLSQSSGRFDYIKENDDRLFELWPEERLVKAFGQNYKRDSNL
jgi:hypothetical protein